jgi:hypothetical protein
MNQKIIIAILVILCLTGLIFVLVLLFNKPSNPIPNPPASSDSYTLSLTEYNNTLYPTIIQNATTTQLSEANLPQYALVSFNNTHEIMWAGCAKGYTTSNISSSTGNKFYQDGSIGLISADINELTQNNLTFTCNKKTTNIINNDNSQ